MLESRIVHFTVPPAGTAENFVGMPGANLVFLGEGLNGELIGTSPYSLIKRLGLALGDPRLGEVKAIFSRLAQVEEIREFGDPGYRSPEPGQPLNAPALALATCRTGLIEMHRRGQKIGVDYNVFLREFARHLAAQGMPELATELN